MSVFRPAGFALHSAPPPRSRGMRVLATTMLAVMAVLFLVATEFVHVHPAIGFVRAFAEAAMVGGITN